MYIMVLPLNLYPNMLALIQYLSSTMDILFMELRTYVKSTMPKRLLLVTYLEAMLGTLFSFLVRFRESYNILFSCCYWKCTITFCCFVSVDASEAGEGNLEITINARGTNIPTQVHPQRNAKFTVSFVPIEPTDHVISIHFNKEPVPGL